MFGVGGKDNRGWSSRAAWISRLIYRAGVSELSGIINGLCRWRNGDMAGLSGITRLKRDSTQVGAFYSTSAAAHSVTGEGWRSSSLAFLRSAFVKTHLGGEHLPLTRYLSRWQSLKTRGCEPQPAQAGPFSQAWLSNSAKNKEEAIGIFRVPCPPSRRSCPTTQCEPPLHGRPCAQDPPGAGFMLSEDSCHLSSLSQTK